MQTRTAFIRLEGLRIHLRESCGSGPPVVLLHGNSTSGAIFEPLLEGTLGAKFHCVAPDMPGQGDSGRSECAYGIRELAQMVSALIDRLKLGAAVMVGWSLGGHVFLQASKFLKKASGFCLFGTPPLPFPVVWERLCFPHPALTILGRRNPTRPERDRFLSAVFGGVERITTHDIESFDKSDGRMREELLESIGRGDFEDETALVRSLKAPLAVLHGELDPFVRLDYLRSLSAPTLWRGLVQVIQQAGHAPFRDRPDQFESLLDDFIRHCSSEGHSR